MQVEACLASFGGETACHARIPQPHHKGLIGSSWDVLLLLQHRHRQLLELACILTLRPGGRPPGRAGAVAGPGAAVAGLAAAVVPDAGAGDCAPEHERVAGRAGRSRRAYSRGAAGARRSRLAATSTSGSCVLARPITFWRDRSKSLLPWLPPRSALAKAHGNCEAGGPRALRAAGSVGATHR